MTNTSLVDQAPDPGQTTSTTLPQRIRAAAAVAPEASFATQLPGGETVTYGRLAAVAASAQALLRHHGIGAADRVVLLATTDWTFFPLLSACAATGSVLVPVNPELHPSELSFILQDAAPRLIVTDGRAALGTQFQSILTLGIPELAAESGGPNTSAPVDAGCIEDVVLMVYTSGTTGGGKAVMLTQGNLTSMADLLRSRYDIGPEDCFLCVVPLHHMNGIMLTGLVPLLSGARTVLSSPFAITNAKRYWTQLAEHSVTVCSLVPSIMSILLRLFPDGADAAIDSVRFAFCGTAPLPADLWQRFESTFGMPVYQGYGLTETTTWATSTPPTPNHRYDTVGVPLGSEIRVAAEGTDRSGEILIRGPMVMPGYYKKAQLTKEQFKQGYLRTGDLGYVDTDGELCITGRKKEIIIKNGVNLNPLDIDAVLSRHADIVESKTVGLDSAISGEAIISVCVARVAEAPPSVLDVKNWVRANMSEFYCPNQVVFMNRLPKGPTGKVGIRTLKRILTGELAEESLKRLTMWKYKRSRPSNPERIQALIQDSLLTGTPTRFLTYWGCGRRDAIADVDRCALDRLAEVVRGAEVVREMSTQLTVMLNDVHSTINQIPSVRYQPYYEGIADYATGLGLEVVRQSEAWSVVDLEVNVIVEQADEEDFRQVWESSPVRDQLARQAAKHFRGGDAEQGARQYLLACLREGSAFARLFKDHIFLTYNGPEFDCCLPDLPKLYLYSYRKGKTEKPWFVD